MTHRQVLGLLGLAALLVVIGVALIYLPAGFIVAGLGLAAVTYFGVDIKPPSPPRSDLGVG